VKPKVAIVKTGKEDLGVLKASVRQIFKLLDQTEQVIQGKSILIKPNITAENAKWQNGVVTNPHLIRAIVEVLSEMGPKNILIGEATAVGSNVKKAFDLMGYREIAEETGAILVDLYDEPFVAVPVIDSDLNDCLEVSKIVIEADFLINVPVLKTHVAAGITACMKNLMGTISKEQKKKFHFNGLAESVVDLNSIVKPNLLIVDGTIAGEGDGPMSVEPVGFRTLIAGTNSRVVDIVCAQVMGFEPTEIDMLNIAEARWGQILPGDIEVVGADIKNVARPFRRAADAIQHCEAIDFHCENACNICSGVIEVAIRRAQSMDLLDKLEPFTISCGKGATVDAHGGKGLIIGKCLAEYKDCENYIPGCPPQIFLITDELRERAGMERIFGPKDGYNFEDTSSGA
jgi:uncharacterized protein (DUF362 family)